MQTVQRESTSIKVLYDGQCPICRFGVSQFAENCESEQAEIFDARKDSSFKREATQAGLDLDRGMVVEHSGRLFHGAAALRIMAERTRPQGLYNRFAHALFSKKRLSALLYPIFRMVRKIALALKGVPPINAQMKPKPNIIRRQLGESWNALVPDIRKRFSEEPAINTPIFYRGIMHRVERSRAGCLLALLTKIIGNPLPPMGGKDIQTEIALHRQKGRTGVFWRRTYYFAGHAPYTAISEKCENASGGMEERVGCGFGMRLQASAKNGHLYFRSTRYFWRILGIAILLPHWLTPGQTTVEHRNISRDTFRFTLSMDHPLLGRTFFQTGIFKQVR